MKSGRKVTYFGDWIYSCVNDGYWSVWLHFGGVSYTLFYMLPTFVLHFSDAFNILQILDSTAMGTISIATIVLASKAVCCQSSTVQGTNLIHQQGGVLSPFLSMPNLHESLIFLFLTYQIFLVSHGSCIITRHNRLGEGCFAMIWKYALLPQKWLKGQTFETPQRVNTHTNGLGKGGWNFKPF